MKTDHKDHHRDSQNVFLILGSSECKQYNSRLFLVVLLGVAGGGGGGLNSEVRLHCTCYFVSIQIMGEGIHESVGQVLSVSEQTGLSTVQLQPPTTRDYQPARWSDAVQVPTSRLKAPRNEVSVTYNGNGAFCIP